MHSIDVMFSICFVIHDDGSFFENTKRIKKYSYQSYKNEFFCFT